MDEINALAGNHLAARLYSTNFHFKFDLGSQAAFFVLDAQNQLAQTHLALASAQTNDQIALAALDHATRELLLHHHLQIK